MMNEKEKYDESKYKIEFLGEKFSHDLLSYKVIILGLYGVGKTTIINKLMVKESGKEYAPTISVDIKTFQVKVNDKTIQIQIWDCCGNDEFALHTPNLFKNASIAILVYAINDKKSYQDIGQWYNMLLNHCYDHTIFLIGNKSDLEKERKVTIEEAENYKNNYANIKMFFETSAKNFNNIDKLLENIAISIYEKNENVEKNLENNENDENHLEKVKTIKLNKENHKSKNKNKNKCVC